MIEPEKCTDLRLLCITSAPSPKSNSPQSISLSPRFLSLFFSLRPTLAPFYISISTAPLCLPSVPFSFPYPLPLPMPPITSTPILPFSLSHTHHSFNVWYTQGTVCFIHSLTFINTTRVAF